MIFAGHLGSRSATYTFNTSTPPLGHFRSLLYNFCLRSMGSIDRLPFQETGKRPGTTPGKRAEHTGNGLTAGCPRGEIPRTLGEIGQKMERQKEVMTLREASQYLGISPDTLYKYLGEKSIPAFKLGNRWRFKKDLLDRWMERKSERTEVAGESRAKRLAKSTVKG